MTNSGNKRHYHDRLRFLKDLIHREIPDSQVDHVKVTRFLAVEWNNTRVIFSLGESLMTDEDTNETIFADGVHLTKEIFKNPPQKHSRTQGIIHLSHNGASFTQKASLSHSRFSRIIYEFPTEVVERSPEAGLKEVPIMP